MKKTFPFTIMYCLIMLSSTKGQNYFEQLPFPDSAYIYTMDVNSEGHIFVSAGIFDYSTCGIYRSLDNGYTWDVVLPFSQSMNKGLDITSSGQIYALRDFGENETLFKSIDNGETWDSLFVPLDIYSTNQEVFTYGSDTLFISQNGKSAVVLLKSINGGLSWDTLFYRDEGNAEYISDLVYKTNGEMYLSIAGFLPGDGGLFKSTDHGTTWSLFGLDDFMVTDLAYNSTGDLFISTMEYSYGGIYAVFENSQNVEYLCTFADFTSIVINSSDDIFAGVFDYGAVYHTSDNCITFNWITSGLGPYPENMFIDNAQHIYLTSYWSLYRTVQPTITSTIHSPDYKYTLHPNPSKDEIKWLSGNFSTNKSYQIFDLHGRLIKNGFIIHENEYCKINTSDLTPGTYLLKVSEPMNLSTVFIKE